MSESEMRRSFLPPVEFLAPGGGDKEYHRDNDVGKVLCAASALLSLSPACKARDAALTMNSSGSDETGTAAVPPRLPSPMESPPLFVGLPPPTHALAPRPSRLLLLPSCASSEWSCGSGDSSLSPSRPPPRLVSSSEWSCSGDSSADAGSECGGSVDHNDGGLLRTYYTGNVSLALEEDEEVLSPLHCFMRRYCVEAFAATRRDVSTPRYGKSHGGRIVPGQVGIRCIHCKHRSSSERRERSVCFPSSLKNIYHSIETFQRRHSVVCQDIPAWIKTSMADLMRRSRSGAGGRRQYWEESAAKLGMANTSHGIRFLRVPGDKRTSPTLDSITGTGSGSGTTNDASVPTRDGVPNDNNGGSGHRPSVPLVCSSDRELVTGYLFLLLDQMEVCRFSERDRAGGRSKVKDCPVGYPGMQCKHCAGKAGFGRYFPATLRALTSANSDRNIFNHIVKCRRCPGRVREELARLHGRQQFLKNRRGSRKLFFQRVWERLHQPPAPLSAEQKIRVAAG